MFTLIDDYINWQHQDKKIAFLEDNLAVCIKFDPEIILLEIQPTEIIRQMPNGTY